MSILRKSSGGISNFKITRQLLSFVFVRAATNDSEDRRIFSRLTKGGTILDTKHATPVDLRRARRHTAEAKKRKPKGKFSRSVC
jgi:hypothetical protein